MIKKTLFVGLIILYFVSWVSTGVRKRDVNLSQYEFELNAGSRIVIINNKVATKTSITVSPSTAREFDMVIPEGKEMKGVLTLR